MAKKELSTIKTNNQFNSIGDGDCLFGYSYSANQYGFFKSSIFSGKGYACRRRDVTAATPIWEAVGNIDYLLNFPALIGLGCYLVDDGHNRRKLDPSNHYKLATGEVAALDGSMGQYQWGWGTPWYYATWMEGSYLYIAGSLNPIPGKLNYLIPVASTSALGAGVMDRTNDKLCSVINASAQYRGGSNTALAAATYPNATGQQLSMLGMPASSIGTATFEAKAANRGAGWGAGWYWIQTLAGELFRLVFGTNNVQAAVNATRDANGLRQGGLGTGITGFSAWDAFNGLSPVCPTDIGVSLADGCGEVSYNVPKAGGTTYQTVKVPVFYGYKNIFGHLYRGLNRVVCQKQANASYKIYAAKSMLTAWSYSDIANMEFLGTIPIGANTWSYIKNLNRNGLAGLPSEVGATGTTFYCDAAYLTTGTSGYIAPLASGYAYSGGYAGLAYFGGDGAPSCAVAYLSSPLCECDGDFSPVPTLVAA